jgi:hypothetical protein
MSSKPPYYRVYLLTVWQEQSGTPEKAIWRFRLEDARSGRQALFTDTVTLFAAIQAMISTPDQAQRPEGSDE